MTPSGIETRDLPTCNAMTQLTETPRAPSPNSVYLNYLQKKLGQNFKK